MAEDRGGEEMAVRGAEDQPEADASAAAGKRTTAPASTSPGRVEADGEDDMAAKCLILLARGGARRRSTGFGTGDALTSKPPPPTEAGFYVYQCRTCERRFPSFQALGGHRASHKRPRLAAAVSEDGKGGEDANRSMDGFSREEETRLSLRVGSRLSSRSGRVHECVICGAEFASGQALGGHMRRHRMGVGGGGRGGEMREPLSAVRPSLDLNLPAPEERAVVFSASSLVDCHY